MLTTQSAPLLDQWRKRFGGRHRRNHSPRRLAAMGCLVHGPILEGLVELEKLLLVVLHDQPTGRGQYALRLAGYSGRRVPWGVRWGGAEQCRFVKNLLLQPVPGGPGLRLNTDSTDLLRLGLQLDRELDRHVHRPALSVRQQLRLPCLWAGFDPADVDTIAGDGPELVAYCRRTGRPAWQLLERIRREHFGLAIFPLAWVSHHWQQAVAVFADLERYPKRQVFPLNHAPTGLVGFQDAAQFDFAHSPFHTGGRRRSRRRTKPGLVSA
jgi:hypothetical protein